MRGEHRTLVEPKSTISAISNGKSATRPRTRLWSVVSQSTQEGFKVESKFICRCRASLECNYLGFRRQFSDGLLFVETQKRFRTRVAIGRQVGLWFYLTDKRPGNERRKKRPGSRHAGTGLVICFENSPISFRC